MDSDVRHRSLSRGRWLIDYYRGNHFLVKQVLKRLDYSPNRYVTLRHAVTVVTVSNKTYSATPIVLI